MCLAFGVERLDELGEKVVLGARAAAAAGPRRQAARARQAQVAGRLARRRSSRAAPARRSCSSQPDLDRLPIPTCWPGDGGPFITLPSVFTKDPRTGGRNVGMYRLQKHDATSTGLHWQIHKDAAADWREGAGRMEVAVSIGSDPITAYAGSCPAPKHVDELMVAGFLRGKPVELVQCKTVDLQVPARAEIVLEGYCERGELRRRGAVRRPHRLLHARRAVPGAAADGHDDAPRRDLPEHPRRPAAGRGRLARQGHRAPLPARAAHHAARARRLRPARRRRLPQLLHRLDPQGLPGPRAQGHARRLGHRPAVADEDGDRRRRVGRRARLRRGRLAGRRERRSRARRRAGARPARPARPRAVAAVARRQARAGRDADLARRGLPARVARGRAHERRGAPPRRRALGLARHRAPRAPAGAPAPRRQRRGWRRS